MEMSTLCKIFFVMGGGYYFIRKVAIIVVFTKFNKIGGIFI